MSTLAELRAAAEAEFAATHPNQSARQQPVNGTVYDPNAEEDDEPEAQVVEQPVQRQPPPAERRQRYTRTIDLGDGSPPQVFKAATMDELVDKIANAQLSATRRIKELKAQVGTKQPEAAKPGTKYEAKSLTADEEFEISQEMMTNPTSALSKLFKSQLGADPEQVRKALARMHEMDQRDEIFRVGQEFVSANPEFPVSPANERAMAQYIQKNNLAWTVANLEIAFTELQESGLLTAASGTKPVPPAKQASSTSDEPVRRRRAVVGVSTRQSSADDVEDEPQHEPSVDDLLKLPEDERRRIVSRSVRRA